MKALLFWKEKYCANIQVFVMVRASFFIQTDSFYKQEFATCIILLSLVHKHYAWWSYTHACLHTCQCLY